MGLQPVVEAAQSKPISGRYSRQRPGRTWILRFSLADNKNTTNERIRNYGSEKHGQSTRDQRPARGGGQGHHSKDAIGAQSGLAGGGKSIPGGQFQMQGL